MALTPEDVVNKRFQPTKFREGYDQDEVDDFLDEVVVELRRLNQENEELRQRLIQSDSRINQLQQGGAPAPAMAAPAPAAPPAPAPAAPAPAPAFNASLDDQGNTNNLLQLARTLHEQHVREGIEKRDSLIAEGHATAARVVQEAEQAQMSALSTLEQERQTLERKVEELRNFERDYRSKLKGYIEGQLRELEESPTPAPAANLTQPQQLDTAQQFDQPQQFDSPQQFDQPQQFDTPQPIDAPQGFEQQAAPPQGFEPQAAPPQQSPAYGAPAQQQVPQGYPGFAGN